MNTAETVLVTGGHGTMGPWVCRELTRRGARVVVLDLLPEPRFTLPGSGPDAVVVGDVRDVGLVRETLSAHRITRVVHLAAIVGEPCETDPVLAFDVNVIATAHLIEAAESAGVRRLTANSTKGALGPMPANGLWRIETPACGSRRRARRLLQPRRSPRAAHSRVRLQNSPPVTARAQPSPPGR